MDISLNLNLNKETDPPHHRLPHLRCRLLPLLLCRCRRGRRVHLYRRHRRQRRAIAPRGASGPGGWRPGGQREVEDRGMARPKATGGGGGAVVVGLHARAHVCGVFAGGGSGGGVGRRVAERLDSDVGRPEPLPTTARMKPDGGSSCRGRGERREEQLRSMDGGGLKRRRRDGR